MDPIIQRCDVTGFVTVNGQALGPAYFECKRDYKNYSEAMNLLLRYVDTGLAPEEIQEAVDLFQGADDIPNEIKSWVERCTWHVRKCAELSKELQRYKNTGLCPEAVSGLIDSFRGALAGEIAEEAGIADMSRIQEIAKAETEGRLIVLPCKVGDRVWGIVKGVGYDGGDAVCQATVAYITVRINGIIFHTKDDGNMIGCFYLTDFGKTIFLAHEAAEAALGGDAT